MTTLNGNNISTRCIVKSTAQTTNDVHRHLGYTYAQYKYINDDKKRGFIFKKDCYLPIDEGFEFDENEILEWRETETVPSRDGTQREYPIRFRVVKPSFYPSEAPLSKDVAAQLEEAGIHPDSDRLQDLPPQPPAQAAAPVGTPVIHTPEVPALWQVFATDMACLFNLIRRETNAPPAECQRMATSCFIALREATNKLTPEQVDKLRKASY